MRIAAVQMDVQIGRCAENRAALIAHTKIAAAQGAKLVIFPECAVPGYCFASREEALALAEPIPGPSVDALTELCRDLQVFVVFGLLESAGDQLFNACALVGPQGLAGAYRKTHLPFLGVDRFVSPGAGPYEVFDLGELRVGLLICYDAAFPEAARVLALQGADLIALPTNWPPGARCTADYVINTRAMENGVYFAAVNRIGIERGFSFIGGSILCGVDGETLASARHTQNDMLFAEIDPAAARDKHRVRVPGEHEIHRFHDRRPDLYGPLAAPKRS